MASFWGLLGTDISSQLSSLSETERRENNCWRRLQHRFLSFNQQHSPAVIQKAGSSGGPIIRCKTATCMWCVQTISLIPITLLLLPSFNQNSNVNLNPHHEGTLHSAAQFPIPNCFLICFLLHCQLLQRQMITAPDFNDAHTREQGRLGVEMPPAVSHLH